MASALPGPIPPPVLLGDDIAQPKRPLSETLRVAAILAPISDVWAHGPMLRHLHDGRSAVRIATQTEACLGLQEFQGSTEVEIVVQFALFGGRQLSRVRT